MNKEINPTGKTSKVLISIGTIIVTFLFIILKYFTFGFLTFILIFLGIYPVMITLYIITGIRIAKIIEKTYKDYMKWLILSVFLLLHSIVFVDQTFNHDSPGTTKSIKILKSVPGKPLFILSVITFIISLVLIITYFVIYKDKINKQITQEILTNSFYRGINAREIVSVILGIVSLVLLLLGAKLILFPILGLLLGLSCKDNSNTKKVAIMLNLVGIIVLILYIFL